MLTSQSDLSINSFLLFIFFVVLACHLPVLDGFDLYYQATGYFSEQCISNLNLSNLNLSNLCNLSNLKLELALKKFGNAQIQTRGC